jgi:GDP-L-fucose synthase
MIGSAVLRRLQARGFTRLVTARVDLTNQAETLKFLKTEKPDYVFLAVTKLGGIMANSQYPADFIYDNLVSQSNVINAAWKSGVKKLLYFASSCIYPEASPQPVKEEYLLTGELEPTSEAYAIAKIAGIRMCQAYNRQYGAHFISVVPADVYGPGDDFHPETGHVLPALMAKMHEAKVKHKPEVIVWGSGEPRRETLHVDDLADAAVFLMDYYDKPEIINIGGGKDISIKELAQLLKEVVGFKGNIVYDKSKPDGTLRKLLDNRRIKELGWSPGIDPATGIRQTYQWYQAHVAGKSLTGSVR